VAPPILIIADELLLVVRVSTRNFVQILGGERPTLHILYVEDDARVRETTAAYLRAVGHTLTVFENILDALKFVENTAPDVLLCDFKMDHGPDGLVLAEQVRRLYPACPIVMMSHYTTDEDVIRGLDVDVDAYIKRPMAMANIQAKIYAAIQRRRAFRPAPESQVIVSGALIMDTGQRTATWHGQKLALTPIEFRILALLASQPGTVLSPVDMWASARGVQVSHSEARNLVKSHIAKLRPKLEQGGTYPQNIQNVHGDGYKWLP